MYFINSLWESILLKQLAAVFFSSNKRYSSSRPAPHQRSNSDSRSNNLSPRCFYNLNINYLLRRRDDINADRYQSISINWKSTYSNRRRSPRHTRAVRARRACHYKISRKKYARDPSFLNRLVRYSVLHPRGDIRRFTSARRDATFLNHLVRYHVLRTRGEIRRSSTTR